MFTILAWIIFVPAVIWNIVFFSVALFEVWSITPKYYMMNKRNLRDACLSLLVLFISGTYLFGIF